MTQKQLFISASCIVMFLLLVCVNAYLVKSSVIFIGVIQELLLLPILVLQVLILCLALRKINEEKTIVKGALLWIVIMMTCSIVMTFGSFII